MTKKRGCDAWLCRDETLNSGEMVYSIFPLSNFEDIRKHSGGYWEFDWGEEADTTISIDWFHRMFPDVCLDPGAGPVLFNPSEGRLV